MTGQYCLRAENFGPISEAEVELRPLTLLVGPSNTGKSYLAGLLYALHRTLGPAQAYLGGPSFLARRRRLRVFARAPNERLRQAAMSWLATLSQAGGLEGSTPVPTEITTLIAKTFAENPLFGRELADEVARCFGVEDSASLLRYDGGSTAPYVDLFIPHDARQHARFRTELSRATTGAEVNIHMDPHRMPRFRLQRLRLEAELAVRRGDVPEASETSWEIVANFLMEDTYRRAFGPVVEHGAYYLPADRTGVMHSHHVVVSTLLQRASLAGIRRFEDVPMLSGVMADFLDVLVTHISQLEGRRPRTKTVPRLADQLEREVLEGHIVVNPGEVRYPAFSYRPMGWRQEIPLMRASSMVSELAPVVLYLRHIVQRGDLLIIEEPESHLHPAKQAAFARGLAAIINGGVRVVMTTHSEWFLEQIGNLVRASALPPEKRGSIKHVLEPQDVGAWLFQRGPGSEGSTVAEIKLDPDTGLYPADYGAVSDALYNQHAAISNILEGDDE